MNIYIIIILCYLAVLTIMNFWRSSRVKSKEDMMVAGRQISVTKMVFTLICTWIGSGTFIAGAELAAKAGWSSLWFPAGAWVGIIIIYFLAAKIRTFGQYTVGDILEVRYGPIARVVGAIAILISFTVIVSYQFKAGGYILNAISEGAISVDQGIFMSFVFVTVFTAVGGMIAVANTDLPNGIIILTSTILATPLTIIAAGGWERIKAILPETHFQVFSQEFGANPYLKIPAIGLSTLMLILGVQSMYQKFYSARNPREAKKAAGIWVVGTIIVEGVAIVIAVFAAAYFWQELQAGTMEHAAVIIQAAKRMIWPPVGVLLLGAATAVVISTGMNYLLSPTTTLMHDIYLRFNKKDKSKKKLVWPQRILIIILGVIAFFLGWKMVSVLEQAYFAYTLYGVVITPALLAALIWKRATKTAGIVSIILGTIVTLSLKLAGSFWPSIMKPVGDPNADPFGIPIIYWGLGVSVLSLILISFFTKRPSKEVLSRFFPEKETKKQP
ncbi:MAG: sodium:solute symporter family protein [Candidatus Aminicenantes bacterium]|nr:sodium:solute symporter family protein [Candidatus Aminicenantes bacterium]MDH5383443.1 sodium:solute symporter family protein [Candidatus Aminicenantes bacterium]